MTSDGTNSVIVAGPAGAGSDLVTAQKPSTALFLTNGHADTYGGTVDQDLLQTDSSDSVDGVIGG